MRHSRNVDEQAAKEQTEQGFAVRLGHFRFVSDWPTNVRELRALVQACTALTEPGVPTRARDLVDPLPSALRVVDRDSASGETVPKLQALDRRKQLASLVAKHGGNITEVARELGKPRAQIYRWLRVFGLSKGGSR